jgi:hypothetical protein
VAVSTIGPWRATGVRSFWLSPESGRINLWCSVIHSEAADTVAEDVDMGSVEVWIRPRHRSESGWRRGQDWGHNTESNVGVDAVSAPTNVLSGSEHRVDEIPEVPSVTDPNRLGDATVTPEFIDGLRSEYEHVIVAAPPLLPRSQILSEVVAQVFLVLSIGETTPRELSRAVEELRAMGVPAHRCGASLANRRRRQKARSRAVRRTPNPTTVTGSIS